MYRPLSTSLRIDSEKALKYFEENPFKRSEIASKAGVSPSYIRQAINHGYTNKVYWWAVCDVLGVPRDYFNYHEPEPEPEPEPVNEETHEEECLVNLADIQLSLNKIEELITEQNRLLRGRLIKEERTSPTIGNTNAGAPHSFTVKKECL